MSSWAMAARLTGLRTMLQTCRQYSRKATRTPIRALNEDEADEQPPFTTVDSSGTEEDFRTPEFLEMERARLPPGFPPFHKKGKDDTDLSRLAMDTSGSKRRYKSGLIRVEGKRLIQEAFDAKLKPKGLFFSRVDDVSSLQVPSLTCIFQKVTYDKLQRWSKVTTTSGLIGFFKMPDTSQFRSQTTLPFSIICDNIRDPGNLGSILRVAASAGCRKVLLTRGCVDLWNDKVLRTAMGSHFHLCIEPHLKWNEIKDKIEPDACIMYADNKAMVSSEDEVERDDIFYESTLRKKRHIINSKPDCSEELPTFPYHRVAYSQMSDLYLVIGGETEGLSANVLSLKESRKAFRITIPMLNNVESLNVSSALAILCHEIKRQFELYGGINQDTPLDITSTIPAV